LAHLGSKHHTIHQLAVSATHVHQLAVSTTHLHQLAVTSTPSTSTSSRVL
jgi:hypothetical protein